MTNDIKDCKGDHTGAVDIETSYDKLMVQLNVRTNYADGHSHIEYDVDPIDPRLREWSASRANYRLEDIFYARQDAAGPPRGVTLPPESLAKIQTVADLPEHVTTADMDDIRRRVDELIARAEAYSGSPMPHHDMTDEQIKSWSVRAGLSGVPVQSHAFWDIQRALMRSSYDRGFAAGRKHERREWVKDTKEGQL